MALPYKTWEWLAPTILLTVWLVVPVVTVELFLSGIHNEVKDNLLRSKTTMKRLKSNIRIARELNESDEEDMDADLHSDKEDQALEDELRAGEAEKSSPDKADQLGIEVDVETPLEFRSGSKKAAKTSTGGAESASKARRVVRVKGQKEKNHFPMDPRLTPNEHLFMRGLTDLIISKRVAGQNKLRQNIAERGKVGSGGSQDAKGTLFVTYIRTKKVLEAFIFLYEAFNLWSCLFVYSIEWPKLAPTQVFSYGSFKELDLYAGM